MNTDAKGVLLVAGTYIVTIGVAILVVALAIMILMMGSYNCGDMGRALIVLWLLLAALFLASVVVVGVVAWRSIASTAGRWATLIAYGVVMLASYVVFAFGLMVLFNC